MFRTNNDGVRRFVPARRDIAFARQAAFEQIELTVEAKNYRALPLYHKYGFVIYGTRPHGLKYPDGSYDNDYLMIKML